MHDSGRTVNTVVRWAFAPGAWRAGDALGVPDRVDGWGSERAHDRPTWHRMLPLYPDELC